MVLSAVAGFLSAAIQYEIIVQNEIIIYFQRASRAGSEFEFDPFVLAARRKAGGSKNGSKQPPFRAEECESLYDLITKAQSVGRIDEQRVSLDRLNSKASVTSEVGAETKSHIQLRATS